MLTDAETVAKKNPEDVNVLEMLEGAATETIKVALGTTRSARISPLCCLKDTNFGQWQGTKHKVAEYKKKKTSGVQVAGKVLRCCVKVHVEQFLAAQNLRHQPEQKRAVGRGLSSVDVEAGDSGVFARWTR